MNENRKAGVDVKLSDIVRKRAMYAVAVFCIAAMATVGALSMGGNGEETPDSYVDLNETNETGEAQTQVAKQPETDAEQEEKLTQVAEGEKEEQKEQEPEQGTTSVAKEPEPDVQVAEKPEEEAEPVQVAEKETKKPEEPEQTEVLSPQLIAEQLNFNKTTGIVWPVEGEIVIPYSPKHGVYHYTLDQFGTSDAVIVASEVGTEVKAAAKGVVTSIEENYRTGTTVTLALGNNTQAVYGLLEIADLKEGDIVEEGECIGTVAEPTRYYVVEGPSLYFKMLEGEKTLNPENLMGENE